MTPPAALARDKASVLARENQALELKLAGANYQQIADLIGWATRAAAQKAVLRALRTEVLENASELRLLMYRRLERILAGGVYERALKGDHQAIGDVLAILREQRRYVPGLEVPKADDDEAPTGGVTVVFALPEAEHVDPVPQDRLADAIPTTGRDLDDDEDLVDDAAGMTPDADDALTRLARKARR